MKVIHVVRSDSFAGVERYISLVAPRLANRGCDTLIIGGDETQMRQAVGRVEILPAVTTLDAVKQLARIGRVDIIHAHMSAAEIAAFLTVPYHRAQLVATRHFAASRGSGPARIALLPVGRAFVAQIAISEFVASRVKTKLIIPNGVECAEAGPRIRTPSVLIMQRLEDEKRTEIALRAWSLSRLRQHGWRLLIAGRGTQQVRLMDICSELQIDSSVQWLGFVDDPSHLLGAVSILLATAPAEPFGMTVVEAMARGTPVIAAAGGAHPETLGSDAWLFPPDEIEACARLLDRAQDEDLSSYGERLRCRQQELFDIEDHTDRLLEVYRHI